MEIEFNNILTISKKACWWVLFKDHSAHLPAKNAFLYDLVSKTLYNCFLKDFLLFSLISFCSVLCQHFLVLIMCFFSHQFTRSVQLAITCFLRLLFISYYIIYKAPPQPPHLPLVSVGRLKDSSLSIIACSQILQVSAVLLDFTVKRSSSLTFRGLSKIPGHREQMVKTIK